MDLSLLGEVYEGTGIPVTFRPPLNWLLLEGQQREAVLGALSDSEEVEEYSLEVEDIFFDTESLSFLTLSEVKRNLQPAAKQEFVAAFADAIDLPDDQEDNQLVARMDFSIGDMDIVQFRHLRENQVMQESRITFTLLFTLPDVRLVRLDFSIPSDSYQREANKLESSIGTLRILAD